MENRRIIINNKSDCTMPQAMQMVEKSLDVEVIGWAFKDFLIAGQPYTIRILDNKQSRVFNIYNEH